MSYLVKQILGETGFQTPREPRGSMRSRGSMDHDPAYIRAVNRADSRHDRSYVNPRAGAEALNRADARHDAAYKRAVAAWHKRWGVKPDKT